MGMAPVTFLGSFNHSWCIWWWLLPEMVDARFWLTMRWKQRYQVVVEDPQLHLLLDRSAVYLLMTFSNNWFQFRTCNSLERVLADDTEIWCGLLWGILWYLMSVGNYITGPLSHCLGIRGYTWMSLMSGQDHGKLSQSLGVSSDGCIGRSWWWWNHLQRLQLCVLGLVHAWLYLVLLLVAWVGSLWSPCIA